MTGSYARCNAASLKLDEIPLDSKVALDATNHAMTHPLRRFRKRMKITLDQLAERAGMSKSSLSRIENGRQATTEASIRRLISATGGQLSANDFIASSQAGKPHA